MRKLEFLFIAIISMATVQINEFTIKKNWNDSFKSGYLATIKSKLNLRIINPIYFDANKPFEQSNYFDKTNGIYKGENTRINLFNKMTTFIEQNLNIKNRTTSFLNQ